MFGYAVGVSDIRVTFDGRASLDCLQKIYPVGRFIAAGFAGSVEFGFWAINDLQRCLSLDDRGRAWIPEWVLFRWYRRARRAFARAPAGVQRGRAELMLFGVSPTVDLGIPGFAKPTVAILRGPEFVPHIVRTNAVESIGSGSGAEVYAEEMRSLNEDRTLMQMEAGSPGGYGFSLAHSIANVVDEHHEPTVSAWVHVCMVRRESVTVEPSGYRRLMRPGEWSEAMPAVARSWPEFVRVVEAAGADAHAATC
jgi:hypothetical protein